MSTSTFHDDEVLKCAICNEAPNVPVLLSCCQTSYCAKCILSKGYNASHAGIVGLIPWYFPGKVTCVNCSSRGLPIRQFVVPLSFMKCGHMSCTSPDCDFTGNYIEVYYHMIPQDINFTSSCYLEQIKCPHQSCDLSFHRGCASEIPRVMRYQEHIIGYCNSVPCEFCDFTGTYKEAIECGKAHFVLESLVFEIRASVWDLSIVCKPEDDNIEEFDGLRGPALELVYAINKRQWIASSQSYSSDIPWTKMTTTQCLACLYHMLPSIAYVCPFAGTMLDQIVVFYRLVLDCSSKQIDVLRRSSV